MRPIPVCEIGQADTAELCADALLCEAFGDNTAEAAVDGLFLNGDDGAGLRGGLDDDIAVKGLQRVDVHDAGGDAALFELFGRLKHVVRDAAGADEGDVRAVTQDDALADLEVIVRARVDFRLAVRTETQVDGTVHLVRRTNAFFDLDGARGREQRKCLIT